MGRLQQLRRTEGHRLVHLFPRTVAAGHIDGVLLLENHLRPGAQGNQYTMHLN